jgi:hypothetical protein
MTPFAQRIVKELTWPVVKRSKADLGGILAPLNDVHCFEISSIARDAKTLGWEAIRRGLLTAEQTFLPAPKTWLEYTMRSEFGADHVVSRVGLLLCEIASNVVFCDVSWLGHDNTWVSLPNGFAIDLTWRGCTTNVGAGLVAYPVNWPPDADRVALVRSYTALALGALAFINSPRIIGRRQHAPHRGLERELIKHQKVIGSFPLRAWTEILLDVTPPKEADGQHAFEAHLTGTRALHFVRSHLRIRDGKLSFVKAHWRGDASIGIKQSRYVVRGPKAGS